MKKFAYFGKKFYFCVRAAEPVMRMWGENVEKIAGKAGFYKNITMNSL